MRLRCPVCGAPLVLGEKVYTCPQGHSFDVRGRATVTSSP